MQAIDFKRLLREEKKRSKEKREASNLMDVGVVTTDLSSPSRSASSDSKVNSSSSAAANGETQRNETDPEHTESSILRVKNSNRALDEISKSELSDAGSMVVLKQRRLPSWSHAPGFLSLSKLRLVSICEDPASIFYSRTALANDGTNSDVSSGVDDIAARALEEWLQQLPHGESGLCEWKTMNFGKRRVCMFGEEDERGARGGGSSLPPPLREIADQLVSNGVFPSSAPPNHVLLNEYQPGQGILPHTDGPLYESRTATLSLSSSVVIEFTKRLSTSEIGATNRVLALPSPTLEPLGNDATEADALRSKGPALEPLSPLQVLLEPGSLLVFQDDAYLGYCHGIPMDVWCDETSDCCLNAPPHQVVPRGKRYSLTFRHKKSLSSRDGGDGTSF
jgi:hypothetical protein